MLSFLGLFLFIIVFLPLGFFFAGYYEEYVVYGPWLSGIIIAIWLLLDMLGYNHKTKR